MDSQFLLSPSLIVGILLAGALLVAVGWHAWQVHSRQRLAPPGLGQPCLQLLPPVLENTEDIHAVHMNLLAVNGEEPNYCQDEGVTLVLLQERVDRLTLQVQWRQIEDGRAVQKQTEPDTVRVEAHSQERYTLRYFLAQQLYVCARVPQLLGDPAETVEQDGVDFSLPCGWHCSEALTRDEGVYYTPKGDERATDRAVFVQFNRIRGRHPNIAWLLQNYTHQQQETILQRYPGARDFAYSVLHAPCGDVLLTRMQLDGHEQLCMQPNVDGWDVLLFGSTKDMRITPNVQEVMEQLVATLHFPPAANPTPHLPTSWKQRLLNDL